MKKFLSILLLVLLALTGLSVTGILLFRHFVADQVMDKGGMMNPDYKDGCYVIKLDSEYYTAFFDHGD